MDFIVANLELILSALALLLSGVALLVRLTPTTKDDVIVEKVLKVVNTAKDAVAKEENK